VEAIAHFRACLLDTTQTETEKMQESVSWAKFGTNSLKVGREGGREGGKRGNTATKIKLKNLIQRPFNLYRTRF